MNLGDLLFPDRRERQHESAGYAGMQCPAQRRRRTSRFRRESLQVTRLQLPKGRLRIPVRVVRKQCGAVEVTGIGSA